MKCEICGCDIHKPAEGNRSCRGICTDLAQFIVFDRGKARLVDEKITKLKEIVKYQKKHDNP